MGLSLSISGWLGFGFSCFCHHPLGTLGFTSSRDGLLLPRSQCGALNASGLFSLFCNIICEQFLCDHDLSPPPMVDLCVTWCCGWGLFVLLPHPGGASPASPPPNTPFPAGKHHLYLWLPGGRESPAPPPPPGSRPLFHIGAGSWGSRQPRAKGFCLCFSPKSSGSLPRDFDSNESISCSLPGADSLCFYPGPGSKSFCHPSPSS